MPDGSSLLRFLVRLACQFSTCHHSLSVIPHYASPVAVRSSPMLAPYWLMIRRKAS